MSTGNMIERSNYAFAGNFKKILFRKDLSLGLRVIVVQATTSNMIAEGWITKLTDTEITLRNPRNAYSKATYEVWGFTGMVDTTEAAIAYEHNTVFTLRSTPWRRWKFRNKK
jgi:hypothetical protein